MNRFLCVLGLGIGIGVLIAPDKGSATRKRLADCADDLRRKFDEWTGKVSGSVDDVVERLPEGV